MNPGWITASAVLGVQAVVFFRWIYRRMRNDEIARAFVRDVATNHLPHIYGALRQIAEANGVKLEEPPLVRFIDLNGHSRRIDLDDAD